MPNGIDKKTVKQMDDESKVDVLIDYTAIIGENVQALRDQISQTESQRICDKQDANDECDKRWHENCDPRFKRLEKFHYMIGGVLTLCAVGSPIIVAWIGNFG